MNDQFDNAWPAVETTKERWWEAEVHRAAGEIELMSPQADTTRAEQYFERALTIARAQQAKSWELRAAMRLGGSITKAGNRAALGWRLSRGQKRRTFVRRG
jgi:predicted ATPase